LDGIIERQLTAPVKPSLGQTGYSFGWKDDEGSRLIVRRLDLGEYGGKKDGWEARIRTLIA
jgi:hypothetical protein